MKKIKIIEKETKKVVGTKIFNNDRELENFYFWWAMNGNKEDYYLEEVEDDIQTEKRSN